MKKALLIVTAVLALASCAKDQNPFLQEWDTPYGIPPYDKIKIEHYMPAIKAGIAQQEAEIQTIVDNPDAPTFDNTVAALELSGSILSKVMGVLYNVAETENSPEMEALIEEATPIQSEHSDNIYMNKRLYQRVAAIYNGDQSNLTREQQMVLKRLYEAFERNGIGLSDADQEELRKINSEASTISNKLSMNLLAENNLFKDEFGISVSAYPTAMTTTEDRDLRERMFKAYSTRGHNGNENDNRELFLKLMDLRTRKAKLMGYDNSADFLLANKMAHDHQTVDEFLDGIMKAAMARAKEEVADMEKIAGFKIQPWDWWYYSEKVRQQKYALDEDMTKPYFEVNNVRKGVFLAAKILYGINVEEIKDVPVYNPEVLTYKVTDEAGNLVGIFTSDYFPRSSKRGGAWMNNVRDQYYDADGKEVRPIICNVANFTSPDENGVALLTIDEVETAFHEFGHALHGLLSKCHYPSVSGTSVTRDFVETFSQFNENWAFQPELLAQYAKHYQTGEVIPQELVDKILNSSKFNQGFTTGELCAASILDMKWHELSSIEGIDIDEFEAKVCKEMGLIDEIIPRYRTSYFNHIFGGGYSAGYYGYLWAEVIDKDAFAAFEESPNGVWDLELAKKFKETFLEKGGSEEPMVLYKQFRGREPQSEPFLRGRGLL